MLSKNIEMLLLGIFALLLALLPKNAWALEPDIDFNAPSWVEERESMDNDVPDVPKAGSQIGRAHV